MDVSKDITKLCESWWETLADSTKVEQSRFAEQFLDLLGWRDLAPLERKGTWARYAMVSYILRAGSNGIATYFVLPGQLEPPTALMERGLDFCEATRMLVSVARGLHVRYTFITDLHRSYLYDVKTDELLLHADSPRKFAGDFREVMQQTNVEDGALEGIRREPRSHVARHLRDWIQRWRETLVMEHQCSKEAAYQLIDRVLVIRYLFSHGALRRMGWGLQKRYQQLVGLAFSPNAGNCGKDLTGLFHDIWLDWKADLFAASAEVDGVLEQPGVAAPLLRESVLLSHVKFNVATVLESFNYGEPMEKARVRTIPDVDEERETYLAKITPESVDTAEMKVDIVDEGYRAVLHWLDKLVGLYERLETEFDAKTYNPRNMPADMDLFTWSEMDANRPQALADKLRHAVEHGLTVYHATPRQFRTARLLLYLHLISRYGKTKQRFTHFPRVEAALKPRPRTLESDRTRIFHPAEPEEDLDLL